MYFLICVEDFIVVSRYDKSIIKAIVKVYIIKGDKEIKIHYVPDNVYLCTNINKYRYQYYNPSNTYCWLILKYHYVYDNI